MYTLRFPKSRVKVSTPRLADRTPIGLNESRTVSFAEAIWQIKQAERVALAVRVNDDGGFIVVDVAKRGVLGALRNKRRSMGRSRARRHVIVLQDIFGSLCLGE